MYDYESAAWADRHHLLSDAIIRLIGDVVIAFRQLNRIQFDAPWTRLERRRRVSR